MTRGGAPAGFTILETMIFLVVSAAMVVSAITLIGGRQSATEFQQGAREFKNIVDDMLTQVSNGFYPNDGNIACTVAGVASAPQFTGVPKARGSNSACVFLGRYVQFAPDTSASNFTIMSVVARRYVTGNKEVGKLSEAYPVAHEASADKRSLPYGLIVTSVKSGTTDGGAMFVFGSFPKAAASGGGLASGSQKLNIGMVPGTALGESQSDSVTALADMQSISDDSTVFNPAEGVDICIANDNLSRRARLTIGGAGNSVSTSKLELLDPGATC